MPLSSRRLQTIVKYSPLKVIKVFEDFDVTLVGYYQSVLEGRGIETYLKNQFSTSGAGHLPFVEVIPELWVLDEGAAEQAKKVIADLQKLDEQKPQTAWQCAQCGEQQEAAFTNCWKCSGARAELEA